MFNWLTRLSDRIRYGKLITEDYTGKVVKASYSYPVGTEMGGTRWESARCSITVLWEDGK